MTRIFLTGISFTFIIFLYFSFKLLRVPNEALWKMMLVVVSCISKLFHMFFVECVITWWNLLKWNQQVVIYVANRDANHHTFQKFCYALWFKLGRSINSVLI